STAYASIEEFVGPTNIKVGSRPFWNAMFEFLGLNGDAARQAFVLIDKKDKLGAEFEAALREALPGGAGFDKTRLAPQAQSEIDPATAILEVFSKGYRAMGDKSAALGAAVKELDDFVAQLAAMGIKNAEIDLAVMRGHAYYTGVVFEFFLTRFPDLGAVGGGGRYEDLAEKFSKTKIIGVGAAVGFSRMMATLLEADEIDLSRFASLVDAAVLVLGQQNTTYAMSVLAALRAGGVVAVPFLDTDKKARAQFEFADKISAKYSVIIGDDEAKNQVLTLKDMKTGNQTGEKLADAIKTILKTK
ncbi:MAG: ATP phosphoribosyltransferase regulatory subunit, partial [Rickettsiales bacterium]|nr:ATP phosphoribosyltransferase regulatory subunit [Rickettsiales bacterium]